MTETRFHRRLLGRVFLACSLGGLVFALSETAFSKGGYALYQFSGSHDSQCLPDVSNPSSVISRNGIRVTGNQTSGERQALANGLAKIEQLLGGRTLPASWRVGYNYVTTSNAQGKFTWNQGLSKAGFITVRRPAATNGGENETRLMHELGHKVGGAGFYGRYNASVKHCRITPYCSSHARGRNEEFAEAFAAFVTRPSYLKSVCPEAYDFFASQVFPRSNAIASCGKSTSGQEELLLASARTGGGTMVRNTCSKSLLCWLFKYKCPPCAQTTPSGGGTSERTNPGSNRGGQR